MHTKTLEAKIPPSLNVDHTTHSYKVYRALPRADTYVSNYLIMFHVSCSETNASWLRSVVYAVETLSVIHIYEGNSWHMFLHDNYDSILLGIGKFVRKSMLIWLLLLGFFKVFLGNYY